MPKTTHEDLKLPSARPAGSARWERNFYNSYGNYSGFRFQDWCGRCPNLVQTGLSWDCHHPQRAKEKDAPCDLRACPCVEIDGDEDQYKEWSDSETPVLVVAPNDQAHA